MNYKVLPLQYGDAMLQPDSFSTLCSFLCTCLVYYIIQQLLGNKNN